MRCSASLSFTLVPALALVASISLSGCSGANTASLPVEPAISIQGAVHGGQQPVSGAHVYLFAVASNGYGQPSVSLLTSSATANADSLGAYVLTDANGNFTVTAGFACTAQSQIYLYALGGNAGAGANSAAGLLAALGPCPLAGSGVPATVSVNEVTTVAAAYALAGFATDATHIAGSGTPLALTGVTNAFLNAANLASVSTGLALSKTPAGNGVVPAQTINVIAAILSTCVQSNGPASAPCTALFSRVRAAGSAGSYPTDTASAAINLAHFPGVNVAGLYALIPPSPPFTPVLAAPPNDFSLGINFTGGGLNGPYSVAIDAEGNPWFTNLANSTVSKLAPTGAPISPAGGFNNGSPVGPVGITFDPSGNAWIVNAITASLTKYANSGALLSPAGGYTGGGLALPQGIASDANGNIWVANYANSVSEFSNGGSPVSGPGGFTGGGLFAPVSVAIDAAGGVWLANTQGTPNSVTKLSNIGGPISPPNGFTGGGIDKPFAIAIDSANNAWIADFGTNSVAKLASSGAILSGANGYTGGGLSLPYSIAIDGGGNAWLANSGAYSVSEFSATGVPLSPSTGYTGGTLNSPEAIAVDASGNVWLANTDDIAVTELVGAAVPVVCPLVTAIKNNTLGTRP